MQWCCCININVKREPRDSMKRIIAFLLAGLIITTSVYPVNAMGNAEETNVESTYEDVQESALESIEESSIRESEEDLTESKEDASLQISEEVSEEETEESSTQEEITEESDQEVSTEELTEETAEESSLEEEESTEEFSEEDEQILRQQEAMKEFAELVESYELMALIYLTDAYALREEPAESADTVKILYSGETVLLKEIVCVDTTLWCKVETVSEDSYTGYVEKKHLISSNELFLEWEEKYLHYFYSQKAELMQENLYGTSGISAEAQAFPESYRDYIVRMQEAHPNWHFVPFMVEEDFDVAAANEVGERSLIHSSVDASWKGAYHSPNWYYATPFIIRHYMDPRNFLNENDVFQFEQLTYNKSYHNEETVLQLLSKSFMAGDIPGEGVTYAATFMQAGKESTVSPYHLASRVMQEQGAGTSALISGTYPGYQGYYNYFNFSASGKTTEEIIKNGLAYAEQQEWNSRYKSIVGGSKLIGDKYIKVGQDTLYLQKFDMVGTLYTHQYMQNIMAPTTEGRSIRSAYNQSEALDKSFVFKVPVYRNMPSNPCPNKQGVISLKQKITDENGNVTYQYCKTYETVKNGSFIQLSPFMDDAENPADYNDFTWTSSDRAVAPVYGDGCVEFKKPGTATITAAFKGSDALYKGKKATCKVTVYGIWFGDSQGKEIKKYVLREGSTHSTVSVVKLPSNITDKKLYWNMADESVAKVSEKGVITALSAGKTTMTLKAGDYSQDIEIVVLPQSFSFEAAEYKMLPEEELKLSVISQAQQIPEEIAEYVEYQYSSSDESVATIDKNGVVTALRPGVTTITAVSQGMVTSCRVNVMATVWFVYNTGDNPTRVNIYAEYGKPIGTIVQPEEKDGYRFVGWFENPDGSGLRYDELTVVYKDMEFYGVYVQEGEGFYVAPVGDMLYTGSAIKPAVNVYDGNILLAAGRDYTVSYKNNISTNIASGKTPTITVKGKGNYTGSAVVTFNILPKRLDDLQILADPITVSATGKKITKKPTLKMGTKKLSYNKDYTLEWRDVSEGAYKNPGTYEITAVGKGNYVGERKVLLEISDKIQASKLSVSSIAKQTYNDGKEICPNVVVKYKSKLLMEGKDYRLSFANNKEIGTATVKIIGIGDYAGEKTVKFTITGIALKNAKISGIMQAEYTGSEIEPEPVLVYNGKILEKSKDYEVDYEKNVKAGKATVIISGKNEFTGTVKKTFTIKPYSVTEDTNAFMRFEEIDVQEYLKGGVKPKPVVSYKGVLLQEGVDYTLSYKNHTKVTMSGIAETKMPQVIIKGKGNFKGSKTLIFRIKESKLDKVTVFADDAVYSSKKGAFKKTPVLTDADGKKLKAGTDYEKKIQYCYEDGTPIADDALLKAGTKVCVVITGRGNYTGEASCEYRVVAQSLSKAKITINKQSYTGQAIVPKAADIKITFGKNPPLEASDYEIVEVKNNVKKGTATITLKGVGNYGGTRTVKFSIGTKKLFW